MMGDFNRYNDYELLYLIRENIEEAREIIFWKYSFLIKSRIYKLNVPVDLWDDYYQEGCIILCKAIRKYNEFSRMSFTNFFDLLLKRRILTLLKKDRYDLNCDKVDYLDEIPESTSYIDNLWIIEESFDCLSTFERLVYKKSIIEGVKINELSQELGVSSKSISNAKHRIIKKLKNKIKKNNY